MKKQVRVNPQLWVADERLIQIRQFCLQKALDEPHCATRQIIEQAKEFEDFIIRAD